MKICSLEKKGFSLFCTNLNCCETCELLIDIELDNFKLKGQCKNGHIINYDLKCFMFYDILKYTNSLIIYCSKCSYEINEENTFKCQNCNKFLCGKCINEHLIEENHNGKSFYINKYRLCKTHNKINNFFCYNCKINICEDCQVFHKEHIINSYLDIIPNKNKKELYNIKFKEYCSGIYDILDKINKIKKEADERFEKIEKYLNFLLYINENFLKNFNYTFYDYCNYKNFNYFNEYINNELQSKISRYTDYILFGKSLKTNWAPSVEFPEFKNKSPIKETQSYLGDYTNLEYFKDNIFIKSELLYNDKYYSKISFYEFNDFSFELISTHIFNSEFEINDYYKIGKYNSIFCIKKYLINKFEYNFIERKLISDKKFILMGHNSIFSIIDNKNGDVVITDKDHSLIVWKKNNINEYFYEKKIILNDRKNYLLFNVNDNIFLSVVNSNNTGEDIFFYDSESYNFLKCVYLASYLKGFENFNNKILLCKAKYMDTLILIDIKNLEVVQYIFCTERIYIYTNIFKTVPRQFIKINDNYILEIRNRNELKIFKFNSNSGDLIDDKIIKEKIFISERHKIIPYKNDYIFILSDSDIRILKIK